MIPRATYRLQFHKDFTFADAEALIPYLDSLGVSHVYASPITTARRGSQHGYDVTDPTTVNPEIGGETGLRQLAQALRERGMGIIIDIVPNHMGIAGGENPWWQDVLKNGQSSPFAGFFDIDWRSPLMLPVLGGPLIEVVADGHLRLIETDGEVQLELYGEMLLPLRPDDPVHSRPAALALEEHDSGQEAGREALAALLGRQHYSLAFWRTANDQLNWRRFFAINELAGLRAEEAAVFEATHALPFRLFAEGVIDGVRVDHVDGLSDPASYCRQLIAGLTDAAGGRRPYVVVEKILAPDEALPADWSVDGTSGYDFMTEVTALLHDPPGHADLGDLWSEISGRSARFEDEELLARQQLLSWQFDGQLRACVGAFAKLAADVPELTWITTPMLRRAVERLLWVFPVYRTYGTGDSAPLQDAAVRNAAAVAASKLEPPGEGAMAALVLDWLAGSGAGDPGLVSEAVRRFQQLSAPIAAKGVEDTAFYRYGVLLSANEVGSDPSRFSTPINEFHAAMVRRAAEQPASLLALATHDHKRGADARARLATLAGVPEFWATYVHDWFSMAEPEARGIDRADAYMLLQTLVSIWEESAEADVRGFLVRVNGWQEKALREAKLRSSWVAPDLEYEAKYKDYAEALLTGQRHAEFRSSLKDFIRAIGPAADANSLAQTVLHLSVPGIPDIYQGTELADLSLVDPDNRRAVDYRLRQEMLAGAGQGGGTSKFELIRGVLALRRARPTLFAEGDYRPLTASGVRGGHVVAFERQAGDARLFCAVAIRLASTLLGGEAAYPTAQWWNDTRIENASGDVQWAAELFADGVASVSIRPADPQG